MDTTISEDAVESRLPLTNLTRQSSKNLQDIARYSSKTSRTFLQNLANVPPKPPQCSSKTSLTFLRNLPNIPLRPRPNIPLKPRATEHATTFLRNLITYSSRGLVGCGVSAIEDRGVLQFTEEEGYGPPEECGQMFEEIGRRLFQEGRLRDRLTQTKKPSLKDRGKV
ncbi:hypothetical protein DEU56DRAFT_755617 [Suillus clintonianus]|uniref:uncharacterized protein n=1 Tax=Suillus clintonianus TaxID=1904413 RepID=UPI001B870907|nr:uncharacterized protein DEU56DRAFT_755617 [Suillus clintonianus]KAG2139315.1 hypothetical protein DEU56DRAFT_755617 [Suillus clintonianus]